MKSDSRDKIIAAFERAIPLTGVQDYDTAMVQFGKILEWLHKGYHPLRSKAHLTAFLDSMPEPKWSEMRFILGVFKYMPQIVRFSIKRLGEIVEDDVPEMPRGRPGLDAYSKAEIVAHVGKRHTAGYSLDQAKKSAAKRFSVSEATVQRAWDDRRNRDAVDFRSVLKYLSSGREGDFLEPTDEPD